MIEFLIQQSANAHWYAFGLLMLAGLNIPIPEDLVVIGSAVLAATIVPENLVLLIIFPYLGVYLSDLENYWLARLVGPRILRTKTALKFSPADKIHKVKKFLDKYGPYTLLFGRFIPFGFRNSMFMTCGISKMKFWKFALFDFIASIFTTATLFGLGYSFGKNYARLLDYLDQWKLYIFLSALGIILVIAVIRNRRKIMTLRRQN